MHNISSNDYTTDYEKTEINRKENSAFFAQFGCHHYVSGSGDSQQNLFSGGGLGIYQVQASENFGNQAQERAEHSQGSPEISNHMAPSFFATFWQVKHKVWGSWNILSPTKIK